mmetsp:Transcript_41866/g.63271  ORF Transcript_41866/g.63271 Transcript_41866/m.63271 type:complete len:173 (+) Transcript_41866:1117-1635(+)
MCLCNFCQRAQHMEGLIFLLVGDIFQQINRGRFCMELHLHTRKENTFLPNITKVEKKRMSRKLVEVCKRVRRKHTEPSFAVAKGNHENRSAAVGNLEGNIASRTEGKHGTMWTTQDRRRVRPFLSNMFVIEEEDENESISTACTYEVDETSHPKFHEVAIGGSCSKMQIRAL